MSGEREVGGGDAAAVTAAFAPHFTSSIYIYKGLCRRINAVRGAVPRERERGRESCGPHFAVNAGVGEVFAVFVCGS